MKGDRFDWLAHCKTLVLTSEELYQVADNEGLPRPKLSKRQSEQLLRALKKFAAERDSEAIAQGSLF